MTRRSHMGCRLLSRVNWCAHRFLPQRERHRDAGAGNSAGPPVPVAGHHGAYERSTRYTGEGHHNRFRLGVRGPKFFIQDGPWRERERFVSRRADHRVDGEPRADGQVRVSTSRPHGHQQQRCARESQPGAERLSVPVNVLARRSHSGKTRAQPATPITVSGTRHRRLALPHGPLLTPKGGGRRLPAATVVHARRGLVTG